jgi:hypothetical protein
MVPMIFFMSEFLCSIRLILVLEMGNNLTGSERLASDDETIT